MTADDWAARLASGLPVAERVAVVVAHPDDETLWTGALLPRLADGLLIHLTDGAPTDMADAHRLGFATREAYAAARAAELDAALIALGYTGERRAYDVCDKDAVHALPAIEARLAADLAGAALVVTHPYEGGHPDHDAAALAVARVTGLLGIPVVEFACYHQVDGTREFARFWPGAREHSRALDAPDRARIEAALHAHASQASVFGTWRPTHERWRAAAAYDFTAPPPAEATLYDGFGWTLTSDRWREIASIPLPRSRERDGRREAAG